MPLGTEAEKLSSDELKELDENRNHKVEEKEEVKTQSTKKVHNKDTGSGMGHPQERGQKSEEVDSPGSQGQTGRCKMLLLLMKKQHRKRNKWSRQHMTSSQGTLNCSTSRCRLLCAFCPWSQRNRWLHRHSYQQVILMRCFKHPPDHMYLHLCGLMVKTCPTILFFTFHTVCKKHHKYETLHCNIGFKWF